jgi:F0F1-type ATP synthase epsilon subunit
MINQKCPNDLNFYCKAKPDWEIEPKQMYIADPKTGKKVESYKTGGKCKLDPKTCGNAATSSELLKDVPHYTNTYTDKKELSEKPKSQSKSKDKKKEEENLQSRMF